MYQIQDCSWSILAYALSSNFEPLIVVDVDRSASGDSVYLDIHAKLAA